MENFLVNNNIIDDLAIRHNATLARLNQMLHKFFQFVRESFGDGFVPPHCTSLLAGFG